MLYFGSSNEGSGMFEWEMFIFATDLSLLTSHTKCGSVSFKCFLSKATWESHKREKMLTNMH